MSLYCGHCGKPSDVTANFCNCCGIKLLPEIHKKTERPWVRYVTVALLLLAILPWPYGYYLLLRVIVFFVFGYYFFHFRKLGKKSQRELPIWVWAIGGFAILFNPFMPAHLFRLLWAAFNIAGAYLIYKSIEWEKTL